MTDIFSVFNQPALILFDSGASHSFISQKFSAKCQLPFCHTRGSFMIATSGGKVATNQLNQSVPIQLVSAFRPRGVPGPTSKLSLRVPAQMGRRETETQGGEK
jgi:hypothetical protein